MLTVPMLTAICHFLAGFTQAMRLNHAVTKREVGALGQLLKNRFNTFRLALRNLSTTIANEQR